MHVKLHVRPEVPEHDASPGGSRIEANIFLYPGERHEERENSTKKNS